MTAYSLCYHLVQCSANVPRAAQLLLCSSRARRKDIAVAGICFPTTSPFPPLPNCHIKCVPLALRCRGLASLCILRARLYRSFCVMGTLCTAPQYLLAHFLGSGGFATWRRRVQVSLRMCGTSLARHLQSLLWVLWMPFCIFVKGASSGLSAEFSLCGRRIVWVRVRVYPAG